MVNRNQNTTALTDEARISVKALVPNVHYSCPVTFETFSWLEVGDTQEMTFQQLRIMRAKHPRYFTDRWIMPLNDEIIKKLKLENTYTNKLDRSSLKKLRDNDVGAVEEMLSMLDSDSKNELKDKVIREMKKGTITNIKIIRLLEKHLSVELIQYT